MSSCSERSHALTSSGVRDESVMSDATVEALMRDRPNSTNDLPVPVETPSSSADEKSSWFRPALHPPQNVP